MHPENARILAAQHHDELVQATARARHGHRPRWHVSFTRTALASGRAGSGSSVMIIISARRPA
jgi:hypothetical protein